MIARMPERLPYPLCNVIALEWAWGWLQQGLKTFVSFRSGKSKE